ncbi:beta-lactamase Bla (plasmid) [Phaeobacter piscinae]|jgi:beta-lactamase class A|uniref:Beta-lactamase n=1 Tax=Phaeobacter piscinae TaxID=1580596 RepID=A0AAN1GX85_9RHOB|nr:beta-lactamase Bla [Phaeobacter piscinae]AUR38397.1 beta-lactamase Bla [Phaeobacter piscinae]
MKTYILAVLSAALITGNAAPLWAQDLQNTVADWEERLNARIGVVLRDTSSDWEISMRAEERFPMSSTFKSLLCGAVLSRVDAGQEDLDRRVTYAEGDLVAYSPVTEQHLDNGLTVGELCEATVTLSDNTAGNLLLDTVGGPEGLTNFLRDIGDQTTRLDRWETALNEAAPGDPRDTSTPSAILNTLETLLLGDVLEPATAAQLRQWMIDDQVADALIRAHLPEGWVIGDKTGAGGNGSRAIIAFIEPEADVNYFAAIYLTESDADFALRNQVVSEIGQAMIAEINAR